MKWREKKISVKKQDFNEAYLTELAEKIIFQENGSFDAPPSKLDMKSCTFFIREKGKLVAIIDCEIDYRMDQRCFMSSMEVNAEITFNFIASKVKQNHIIFGLKEKDDSIEFYEEWNYYY